MIVVYFPKIKTNIIAGHFSPHRKHISFNQICFLENYLSKLSDRIILIGDFNLKGRCLNFKSLAYISECIKTCPITRGLRVFIKDLDHIFVRGWKKQGIGFLEGASDHRLIYADVF